MVKQIKTLAEFKGVINSESKLVVVDFTATWCGPCQRIGPVFVKLAEQYPDVEFIKVDVDENEETSKECNISCMPTFQFYKGGQKVDEMSGADEKGLVTKITAHK